MQNTRIIIYIAVILIAPTLANPWLVALQAGLGGILLGVRIQQYKEHK